MMTWAPMSVFGLSSTGFMSVCGSRKRGLGLHRLGAADLAAVHGDGAVEGHILRLERNDFHAAPRQQATEAGE
jgi:hypothetical protein